MTRRREREAVWRGHWEAWQASGLTQRAYCQQHALSYTQFCKWRSRLELARRETSRTSQKFIPAYIRGNRQPEPPAVRSLQSATMANPVLPIVPPMAGCRAGIEVHLGNGRHLVVGGAFDPMLLTHLIRVLETC